MNRKTAEQFIKEHTRPPELALHRIGAWNEEESTKNIPAWLDLQDGFGKKKQRRHVCMCPSRRCRS